MATQMRERASQHAYDSVTSATDFAAVVTAHLQAISHDKHLRLIFAAEGLPGPSAPGPDARARAVENSRLMNYGFERVERLPGNIGYLDLRGFDGFPEASDTAIAAMSFLANTDALIVDVRENGGGSPAMIGRICSYLFDEVVHLNDIYWRESDRTEQFWTSPQVEGRRYGGRKPVYVLTSRRTFSAAEEFTYDLKALGRATIVGESTGGGAHPGGTRPITRDFAVWVPSGRAINPITKTNWEGTGVQPDVPVEARLARETAHLDALRKLRSAATARQQEQLDRATALVQGQLDRLKTDTPDGARPK